MGRSTGRLQQHSEHVHVLSLGSWDQLLCKCGQEHRKTAFILPLQGIENDMVLRAKSNGIRVYFIIPTDHNAGDHKAGHWKLLKSRSIEQLELNKSELAFECVQTPLAAHSVDFGAADASLTMSC